MEDLLRALSPSSTHYFDVVNQQHVMRALVSVITQICRPICITLSLCVFLTIIRLLDNIFFAYNLFSLLLLIYCFIALFIYLIFILPTETI